MWYRFADSLREGWWTEELSETCKVLFRNKFEQLIHLGGFIIRIYHDARPSERQIRTWWMFVTFEVLMLVSNCIKVFSITTPCNLLPSYHTTRCHIRDVCIHDRESCTTYYYRHTYYRQSQQILLTTSLDVTCFGPVNHSQALKYANSKSMSTKACN